MRPPWRTSVRASVLALAGLVGCGDAPSPEAVADGPSPTPAAEPRADAESPESASPPESSGKAEVLVERSAALERQGLLEEAAKAAQEAIDAQGGRPARMQAAKVAILRERWDDAEALLRPLLEADAKDADAHYNLGLVAHRRGRYNDARSSYLAALRAKADYADARYNLAVLTWNRNVKQESRHHVARFVERWPEDPRSRELIALVGDPAAAAAEVAGQPLEGSAPPPTASK